MRYRCFLFLVFVGVLFQLVGCDQKKKNLVKISINYPKAAGDTVRIARDNMIDLTDIKLAEVILDSAGKGIVEFELVRPTFIRANAQHLNVSLFGSPGDVLGIVSAPKEQNSHVAFEGDGAAVNQHFYDTGQLRGNLEKWNGVHVNQMDNEAFLKARDSLQRGYGQLLAKFKSNGQVSEEMLDVLERRSKMSVFLYQYFFALGRDSTDVPRSVNEAINEMPIDTIALKTGIFDYALIAQLFYQHKINNAIYEENESMDDDSLDAIFPLLVEAKIKSKKYPKEIEDYLRVKGADYQIRMYGITPSTTKLAGSLEKEIVSAEFKSAIREDIARWEKIGPGKPAPDFTGMTPDGKKLALSDLRGKIVYVDIWATWCGPCVEEFPDSKKVQADFKGNDKVAFLYVSIDRDTLAWKKMAGSNKVPSGMHIINGTDSPNSVWNQYHVWGVPRYLLIDAAGRMVTTHAERPSSGKVQGELRKLLSKSRIAQK